MRKVPEIQKKSDLYHQSETKAAEELLNQYIEAEIITNSSEINEKTSKLTFWEKIKNYLFR